MNHTKPLEVAVAECDRCGETIYLTGNIWPHLATGLLFCGQ